MVQNNKVLTVSYGTFSCTLEGFEDSFDTMKSIAEYFRDLAAEDRYFGAEPPQPDAEMLARIAQKEVARQVEAHTSDHGIHLRTAPALAPKKTSEPETEPARATAAAPTSGPVSLENTSAAGIDGDAAATASSRAPAHAGSTRDVQRRADETSVDTAEGAQKTATAEVTRASRGEGSFAEAAAWGADAALVDPSITSEEDHIVFPEAEPEPAPVSESIAAKLQRIRAVVAKTPPREEDFSEDQHAEGFRSGKSYLADAVKDLEAAGYDNAGSTDESVTSTFEDTTESDVSDILNQIENSTEVDIEREDGAGSDPDLDAARSTVTAEINADPKQVDATHEAAPENMPEAPKADEGTTFFSARAMNDTQTLETPVEASKTLGPEAAETVKTGSTEDSQPKTKATSKDSPRRARGRVIRVRRAAASKALVEATAEDVTPEPSRPAKATAAEPEPKHREASPEVADQPKVKATKAEAAPATQSSLSDDDEAELMAELAAIEAELMASSRRGKKTSASEQDETLDHLDTGKPSEADAFNQETVGLDEDKASAEPEQQTPSATQPAPQRSPRALDGDLSRLMAEAGDKLEKAEAASSRETYNQLRAAVAAAQAEGKSLDDHAEKDAQAQAYRQDLNTVVRPRRPRKDTKVARARSVPLKLVAEQRIDAETPPNAPEEIAASAPTAPKAEGRPLRPRRVPNAVLSRAPKGENDGLDTGFADFVRTQRAVELGELLEAAATYMTKVEGRNHFTRPQLLGKVRSLEDQGSLTREDSLRAFGQLLREGKLDRSSNGQFTTNKLTGFGDDRATG
jgi:hypothetical protein